MFTSLPHARLIALDLETTGLHAAHDRIVEVAAVCWQDGREVGAFQSLVNPERPIPPQAIAVHGITDAMVASAPTIEVILPAFMAFCQGDAVIAHNAKFDLGFLRQACERHGVPLFTTPVVDTLATARRRLLGLPNLRLETLKRHLGLGKTQSHRALDDARDCLAVYLHCLQTAIPSPPPGPLCAPPNPEHLALLRRAQAAGETLVIEYQDGRGRTTRRTIRPLQFDAHCMVVEAWCQLRNDTRHFYLERIKAVRTGS